MKLDELKRVLDAHRDKQFVLRLPNQTTAPRSLHITEVGHVQKTFIDCGGEVHSQETCQLQAWVGEDADHRLNAGKLADILRVAGSIVSNGQLDVEVEYEDAVISQYPVSELLVTDDAVVLQLAHKHTDCLAKDR